MSDGVIFNVYSGATVYVSSSADGKVVRIEEDTHKQEAIPSSGELEQKVSELESEKQSLEEEKEKLNKEINEQVLVINELGDKLEVLREKLSKTEEEKAEAVKKSRTTMMERDDREERIKQLEETIGNLLTEKKQLQKELDKQKTDDELLREMEAQEEKIKELTNQLYNANAKIDNYKRAANHSNDSRSTISLTISEEDKYDGEILDYILEILNTYMEKEARKGSRKSDIVEDILKNNEYKRLHEKQREQLREIFTNTKYDQGLETELRKVGLELTSNGKHMKFNYYGDSRYFTSIAKTPSDGRTIENQTRDIINSMM